MTKASIHITGLPYFPGVVVGRLQKGNSGDIAKRILLISQHEISNYCVLPSGFIVVDAAPFSHAMIGLLGLGVPTVLISTEQAAMLEENFRLLIDGSRGLITDDLNSGYPAEENLQDIDVGQAVLIADDDPVNLLASVRQISAARRAKELGARAIGLVRTEFLLPGEDQVPDKTFYLRVFREICEAASPLSVTFRLLDVAADKIPPWLANIDGVRHALGMQGVRVYNIEPVHTVVEAQLAALAELSNIFSIRVLLPFQVRLEEFDYWSNQLRLLLPADVPIGAMVETPAMVLDIAHLLDHADFIAVGCNDLMQSVFAADREQVELRHYLDPYAPLLYRLFKQVAEQAGERLNHIQLCGVLSQVQNVLPLLLGLGYRNFSVEAAFIPYLANRVSTISREDCESLASKVVAVDTTQKVLKLLGLTTDRHAPFLG